ncbi:MAG: bifunctional folylpolyglutamate synthase/dihydrofolate synthase, partial [Kiritimatiellae bacterium]|nr:bifunctional folylpolyglutamate synthase/dihydrofolate synthase [Kiritimatiellia bacterium]
MTDRKSDMVGRDDPIAPRRIEKGLERCALFGMKPGLDSIGAICSRLGNPQDALRIVHVAGTNGKGATCALIESSLRAAGFSTGRYTSPHLVSLNERFMLNGAPVSEESLDEAYASLPDPEGLTYFELLT